ncbi:hypothetical protein COR50_05895 [Chitinophaga caeni]|uniref:Uncharacterized protein n=1 Tax=Chitinophaga caeni TaxID=2029983 RepID=A0A291QS80_9BACT|nr:hypothetical protein [Chitinophaga caeni]ATL46742.1 hypothetical protein COR50_05895 [Chitinophaga caeni]
MFRMHVLNTVILCGILLFCTQCDKDVYVDDNCQYASMYMFLNGDSTDLSVLHSTLQRSSSMGEDFKLFTLAAIDKEYKIIFNIKDVHTTIDSSFLENKLRYNLYTYNKSSLITQPLVSVGKYNEDHYEYAQSDTASITISSINENKLLITGEFYVKTSQPEYEARGKFSKVCFLSFK